MRILSVHNQYQIRGGEDESREAEQQLLRDHGHQVDVYEESNDRISTLGAGQLALKSIWSTEAYREVECRLRTYHYDIVHVQNFFPLISPAVHHAAKASGVPVIQTLRNYRLLCPNALFFRAGQVCEDCLGKAIPLAGIRHRCYRNSLPASVATTAMLVAHRAMGTWNTKVDHYIALTQFAATKLIEGGLPADKIVVKPNFIHPDPGLGSGKGDYALYVGRLSVEKGLDTLLQAWQQLKQPIPLKIVGDGPLSPEVEAAASQNSHIEWLGRQPMAQVHALMGEAQFLVFPSKWYETFGRVAVEAFAKGTPVIASQLGAMAELVDPGRTGLLFEAGSADDLAAAVDWATANPHALAQMRQAARQEYEAKYTALENYHRLMDIYQRAIANVQRAA